MFEWLNKMHNELFIIKEWVGFEIELEVNKKGFGIIIIRRRKMKGKKRNHHIIGPVKNR